MFVELGQYVKITTLKNETFVGFVTYITIQPDDDGNNPHCLLFLDQDYGSDLNVEDFGCLSIWVDGIKKIEILDPVAENIKKVEQLDLLG